MTACSLLVKYRSNLKDIHGILKKVEPEKVTQWMMHRIEALIKVYQLQDKSDSAVRQLPNGIIKEIINFLF